MAERCTYTWTEGKYIGQRCGRPVARDERCAGCLAGRMPTGPRATIGTDPGIQYLSADHSLVTKDQLLQHLQQHQPSSATLWRLLGKAVYNNHEVIVMHILDRSEQKEHVWAEQAKLDPPVLGATYRMLLERGRVDMATQLEAKTTKLGAEELAKLYRSDLRIPSLAWLVDRGPVKLKVALVQKLVIRLRKAKEEQLARSLVALANEYDRATWECILEHVPMLTLTDWQYHLAPGWVLQRLPRWGIPTCPPGELVDLKWCPPNAPPCQWVCGGACCEGTGPEVRDLSETAVSLLRGDLTSAREMLRVLRERETNAALFRLANDIGTQVRSYAYDSPALARALPGLLLLLEFIPDSDIVGATAVTALRLERLPVAVLKTLGTKYALPAIMWAYLGRRMLLPHRTLATKKQMPFSIYTELLRREASLRAVLTVMVPGDLAGYVLAAI